MEEREAEEAQINLIYYDPRASSDLVLNGSASSTITSNESTQQPNEKLIQNDEVKQNVRAVLPTFHEVHLVKNSIACVSKIRELEGKDSPLPTILLIYAPETESGNLDNLHEADVSPGPHVQVDLSKPENIRGVSFLRQVKSRSGMKHMTCVLLLAKHDCEEGSGTRKKSYSEYFAFGAADVLHAPISSERASALPAHAYRSLLERPGSDPTTLLKPTKRSSLSVDETKPYAYLRESMVSGLMDRICNPGYIEKPIDPLDLRLTSERKALVARTIGLWTFSAHEFSDDELLYAAFLILQHVLEMPGLEHWRISQDELIVFLMACRRVYNSFVIYHNFRHACDVLQASFCFLLAIGAVPPYPQASDHTDAAQTAQPLSKERTPPSSQANSGSTGARPDSEMSALLRPFDAMALVISCIGHDVGHPGVNNVFLVTLNAPLAQLYNDRSVLESFHCAAFSQILRRYWPTAFADFALRKLMINAILATDMSHHTYYIDSFRKMQKDFESCSAADLDQKTLDGYRELLCCMLIKCADICNVARSYNVATEWADILTNEFANQAMMESELHLPSCLFGGAPVLNDLLKMGTSQIGFINIFAIPLFTGMSQALPGMKFTVEELTANKAIWERIIAEEKSKTTKDAASTASKDRAQSPHTRRGSAFAQSQMRADPMVFGSHSASSLTQTRRPSATIAADAMANASRRASLGPTVLPANKSLPSSRRGSTGVIRTEDLAPQVRGAMGTASAMGYDGHQSPPPDGSVNGNLPQSSTTGRSSSVQELLSNPPDFIASDPNSAGPSSSDLHVEKQQHNRLDTATPSTARGRGQTNSTEHSGSGVGGEARPRSKTRRKLSFKFWRKSKSAEALSREP